MRPLLMGLAVVASLVTSLIGDSSFGVISVVAQCGGQKEEGCDYDDMDEPESHNEDDRFEEYEREAERNEEYEAAYAADEWADEFLIEERVVATYWRSPLVQADFVTRERMGRLGTPEGRYIYGSYVCDRNYDNALSGGCVPADRDYDCWELRSWGIVNIPIMDRTFVNPGDGSVHQLFKGEDWMLLDDDHDGMGCEVEPVPVHDTAAAPTPMPIATLTKDFASPG